MPTYSVVKAQHKKAVQGQSGPMQVINLWLQEYGQPEVGPAEWFTRADTNVPVPGDRLDGEVSKGQYGLVFKKAKTGGFGGGRNKPPEERRSIAMQASQKVAVDIAALALQHGMKSEDVEKVVEACAQRLFEQVQRAEAGS